MPRRFAAAVALFYLPIAVLALAFIAWRGGTEALGERLAGGQPLRDLALGTAVGLASAWLLRVTGRLWEGGRRLEKTLADLIGPLPPVSCAVLALSSGIGEELAFRAALLPEIGLVWSSLIFGLVHAPHAPASRRHSKVALSSALNSKLGSLDASGSLGAHGFCTVTLKLPGASRSVRTGNSSTLQRRASRAGAILVRASMPKNGIRVPVLSRESTTSPSESPALSAFINGRKPAVLGTISTPMAWRML